MQRVKLTNGAVEQFQCRSGRKWDVLWDGEVKGFGMRLSAGSGTRTYFLQFRVKGSSTERQITIGRHSDPWRVDRARAKALELKAQMLNGLDPVLEVKRKREESERQSTQDACKKVTLREIRDHYLEHRRTKYGPLRPKTKESIRKTLDRNLSAWLDKPMATTITRDSCLVRFAQLSERAPVSANLVMMYLRALCNHARELYANENGEFTMFAVNPVARMFKLRKPNTQKPRTSRIPKERIGHVWVKLQELRAHGLKDVERIAADWICTMLLTGTRLSESGSLKRSELNLSAGTIRLRGDVVKNHHDLTLPISATLHEILEARLTASDIDTPAARRRKRERSTEYVFPSFGKKQPFLTDARSTLEAVSEAAGIHVSPHVLRRTYEDILKFAGVDPDERRLLLNHLARDVHGAHYANDDDPESLRPAVEAASNWVLEQARIVQATSDGANVIAFPTSPQSGARIR